MEVINQHVSAVLPMKKLLVYFLLAACLFLWCVAVYALTVPFDPSGGLVEVDVLLDGHIRARFGIDTGADKLYIDKTFARKHGLSFAENTRRRKVAGVDGASSVSFVDLNSLAIGEEIMNDLRATAIDMHELAGSQSIAAPDGLIGFNILRRFYVTVDYPARMLTLQTGRPRFLSGRKYSEFSFRQHKHLILVEVTLDDQATCPMILDYCASHTLISPQLAGELGLDYTIGKVSFIDRISMSGLMTGPGVVARNVPVVVTDFSQYRRSVPRAGFAGILGGSFLSLYKVTVDYQHQRVYFHK